MKGADSISWSAIIVTYNSARDIVSCLESLRSQRGVSAGQIVVVDNASSDLTTELVASQFPDVALIRNSFNAGFGVGCNIGLAHTNSEYCFIINPDTVAEPDCVRELVSYMESQPETACIGPAVVNDEGRLDVSSFAFTNLWLSLWGAVGGIRLLPFNRVNNKWVILRRPPPQTTEVDRLLGAAMMIKCIAWKKVGGFDERFFLYSEEEDLCFRLREAGGRIVYYPDVRVIHHGGGSSGVHNPRTVAAATWSRYLYLKKHRSFWEAGLSRWVWILGLVARYIGAGLLTLFGAHDHRAGYREALRSLLSPGYFDSHLRPRKAAAG
jgi:hypothetical protein